MYDFGMAWFSMVVLTAYFILYFKEIIVGEKGYADFLWGVAISSAMAVSVLLSPLLGATADASGKKKSFLVAFAGVSILSVFSLYFTGPGQKAWAVFLVSAGYVGYTLAMTFYNAFLPEIAAPGSIEKLSGIGWGLGYIGGLAALVCMAFMVPNVAGGKSILLLAGAVYGIFALPSFLILKDSPKRSEARDTGIREGFSRLILTFREIHSLKSIFIFLIAYFFVSDAISTVIVFFSSYTVYTLQFTVKQNFFLLMLIQLSGRSRGGGRRNAREPNRNTAHDRHHDPHLDISPARDNRLFEHLSLLHPFGLRRAGAGRDAGYSAKLYGDRGARRKESRVLRIYDLQYQDGRDLRSTALRDYIQPD